MHKKTPTEVSLSGFRKEQIGGGLPPRVGSFSSSSHSSTTKGTSSSVTDGWGELVDDDEEEEAGREAKNGSREGSDYGEKLASREDALWGAAMDEWEGGGGGREVGWECSL